MTSTEWRKAHPIQAALHREAERKTRQQRSTDERLAASRKNDARRSGDPAQLRLAARGRKKRRYNVTDEFLDDVDKIDKCPLCEKNFNEIGTSQRGRGRFDGRCIDHDPSTGEIRGVICGACNIMLGVAGDNIETLRRAVDYLSSVPSRS